MQAILIKTFYLNNNKKSSTNKKVRSLGQKKMVLRYYFHSMDAWIQNIFLSFIYEHQNFICDCIIKCFGEKTDAWEKMMLIYIIYIYVYYHEMYLQYLR